MYAAMATGRQHKVENAPKYRNEKKEKTTPIWYQSNELAKNLARRSCFGFLGELIIYSSRDRVICFKLLVEKIVELLYSPTPWKTVHCVDIIKKIGSRPAMGFISDGRRHNMNIPMISIRTEYLFVFSVVFSLSQTQIEIPETYKIIPIIWRRKSW